MWNEILKKIDHVHTPRAAVFEWGGNIDSVHLVSEGINLVYQFEKSHKNYYLRITHASLRNKAALIAAIAYQQYLFLREVPVCAPIISHGGQWVETIEQGEEQFLAHVCQEVPGLSMHFDHKNLNLYKRWGKALGKLHQAAKNYPQGKRVYTSWEKSLEELHQNAETESSALKDVLKDVSHFLKNRPQTPENYGLTHGDHREGNVLATGSTVHIIDFDLPCNNWFAEDVFRPFFDSIVYDANNWRNKIQPYLEGYFSIMSSDSLDLHSFSKQIQMKCLEIYLWTKNNWNAESSPGGNNTANWLYLIHQKIIDASWIKALPF